MNRLFCCFIVFCSSLAGCYKENIIFDTVPDQVLNLPLLLELDGKACFLDYDSRQLRYAIATDSIPNFSPHARFQSYSEIQIKDVALSNNGRCNLGTVRVKETYPVEITTRGQTEQFTLSFTTLPLVQLVTNNTIIDDPKKLARLTINYPSSNSTKMSSFVGIEHRGGVSQFNPKKSYGFSFLKEGNLSTKRSKAVFDWSPNEDWILDALYNDPSKVRNALSFQLWQATDPTSKTSIQTQFVELYLNNTYQGLYSFNEQMNAEHLGLLDQGAVLYKATAWEDGATAFSRFNSAPPSNNAAWDGWEQKHPAPKEQLHWQPLEELRAWAVNSADTSFEQTVLQQVDLDNLVDYYLFMNLVAASDNYGKNLFWMRPNAATPLSIIPWDLDATWGRFWDGSPFAPTGLIGNALFERLLTLNAANFRTRLKNRWLVLRAGPWSDTRIQACIEQAFVPLFHTNVIDLEQDTWGVVTDVVLELSLIHI